MTFITVVRVILEMSGIVMVVGDTVYPRNPDPQILGEIFEKSGMI